MNKLKEKDQNFKVPLTSILEITPHPNPAVQRLEIATIYGFSVVVGKGSYKIGDKVIYFPVNSILPSLIENYLFSPDAKIKLEKSRIRACRIQKFVSQGMIAPWEEIKNLCNLSNFSIETDLQEKLQITKYYPPSLIRNTTGVVKEKRVRNKPLTNKYFKEYNGCVNIKWEPHAFTEDNIVQITEKLHGCVRYDTLIHFVDGSTHRIMDIVNNKLEGEVWGYDEINKKLVPSLITNWFNNGKSDDWLKIKISQKNLGRGNNCKIIYITSNHEFLCPDKNEYISADNLSINDNILYYRNDYQLSFLQKEILTGIMLGDGSLCNHHISFGHKKEHEEYVDYILQSLGDIAGNRQKDAISGYGTVMCIGKTIGNISINEYFSDWFKETKKCVPKINLTPISLAFWYMDDGSLSHHVDQQDRACFATCGFDEQSILNLLEAFSRIGIVATSYTDNVGYNRIRLNADEAEKLFLYIAPYMPSCMKYKLPERYRDTPTVDFPKFVGKYKPKLVTQSILEIDKYIPEQSYKSYRYDLETSTHNYIANGIVVHNSNFRSGYLYLDPCSFWDKIKKFFGLLPEHEWVYGSNSVQRQKKSNSPTWYKTDIYAEMAYKYDLKRKLKEYPGYVIYGEIIGPSIQRGYHYGLLPDKKDLVIFDIMYQTRENQVWLSLEEAKNFCKKLNLKFVPVLYYGKWDKKIAESLVFGDSVFAPSQKIREGIVVKNDDILTLNRKKIKILNTEYTMLESEDKTTDYQEIEESTDIVAGPSNRA